MKILVGASETLFDPIAEALTTSDPTIQAARAATADQMCARLSTGAGWDITLLDFDLAGLVGLKGIQKATVLPGTGRLLSLLPGDSAELAQRAMAAGAHGVLARDLSPALFLHALHLADQGLRVTVLNGLALGSGMVSQLSERELQVLARICQGMQNKEIAHEFSVQEVTVKMHVRAIIRKLGARNRTHAAMLAHELHLV